VEEDEEEKVEVWQLFYYLFGEIFTDLI